MFSTLEDASSLPQAPVTGLDVSGMSEEELYNVGDAFEQHLEDLQAAADDASMLDEGIGHLRFNTAFYSMGEDWLDKRVSTPDPEFNLKNTLKAQKVDYNSLPEWKRDLLDTAISQEHLDKIQDRIADRDAWKANAENLSGIKTFAADLLSEVFNPINYTPGLLYKAPTRAAAFIGNALISGSLAGLETGVASSVYHDITTSEVVASVVGGALVGGTVGSVIGRNGAERQEVARSIIDAAEHNADAHAKILTQEIAQEGSVGAARVDPYVELTGQVHAQFKGDPADPHVMEAFLKMVDEELPQSKAFIRPDAIVGMSESLQRSDNPMARYLGSKVLEHGEGTGGRQQAEFTADLLSDVYFSEFSGRYADQYTKNFKRFKQAIKGTDISPQDFGDLVYKDINAQTLLLTETPYEQLSPLQQVVRDQANAVMSVKKSVNALAREKGVTELGEFNPARFNMTRQYDGNAFVRLANLHGKESVIQLIKRAVLTGEHFEKYHLAAVMPDAVAPDLDAIAHRIGQAVFNRMSNRAIHQGADANILTTSNKKLLLAALKDINVPEADYVHIKSILDTAGKDRFADPTKGQISMNMSAEYNGLKMTDLLNTDMAAGVMADIKYWTGRAALAEAGFPDRSVYDTALDSMTEVGKSIAPTDSPNATAAALQRTQAEYNKLDKAWDLITGMPIDAVNTQTAKTMRALRKLASVSKLGKLGFAQSAETARMVTAIGVRDTLEGIPYLAQMRRSALTGKMNDSILRDLEDAGMGRIGDEYMLRSPDFRVDDLHANAFLGEKYLDNMNYYMGHLSGFNAVSAMQKRFFARQYAMKLYRAITQDKLPKSVRNELGWSAVDVAGIKRMMETKVDDTGMSLFNNRKPVNLNVSYWDGPLREKFISALHRSSNRAILKQSVGDLPLWAHTSIGKFFAQFRTFALASGGKQGVYDMKMLKAGNVEGLNTFLFTTAMGTALYIAKTQIDAAGLTGSERNKFLETRLSPAAMTRGCLAWSGQLGVGAEALDYIGFGLLNWGGDDDSIHFSRGVEFSDALSSVPGIGYVSDLTRGTTGLLRAGLTDYKFKRADARALLSTLPMSNLMGITNARNLIQERF